MYVGGIAIWPRQSVASAFDDGIVNSSVSLVVLTECWEPFADLPIGIIGVEFSELSL